MDLLMSVLLFFGGLSRGVLYYRGWATYDALVGLPLSGAINSLSVIATIGVTFDRVLYLWNPVQCTKPKFCNPKIARKLMAIGLVISVLLNIPYCFIFTWDEEGDLVTTDFFDSLFYTVFNWFMLLCFSILPAVILVVGNGFLVLSLRKARKIGVKCKGKRKDHTNLTITLISIIVLFLISEIPSALVSRTKAVSILFSGDHDRANTRTLEVFRQICTLLGAINVTINFIFYYLFCPTFYRAFKKTFQKKRKLRKSLQVNVFVLNTTRLDEKKRGINRKVKTQILEISKRNVEFNFPFSSSLSKDTEEKSSEKEDNNISSEKSRQTTGESYVEVIKESKAPYASAIMEESFVSSSTISRDRYEPLF